VERYKDNPYAQFWMAKDLESGEGSISYAYRHLHVFV